MNSAISSAPSSSAVTSFFSITAISCPETWRRTNCDHTAGLPENVDWWRIDGTKKPLREQRHAVVEEVLKAAPLNPPGTKYEYSNVGFVVLGAILEEKHGKKWDMSGQKH